MKKFFSWLIYSQQTLGEVFVALVLLFVASTFSSFWPNMLSRGITSTVLLVSALAVGRTLFRKKSDVDMLTRKSIQFLGMVLILGIMISNIGWFRVQHIDLSAVGLQALITTIYGLLISLRAAGGIIFVIFVIIAGKLKIDPLMSLGMIYFENIPDVLIVKTHRLSATLAAVVTLVLWYHFKSISLAFIYGTLVFDVMHLTYDKK